MIVCYGMGNTKGPELSWPRKPRSLPFVADAAPSSGRALVSPEIGEALKEKFRLATEEWSDEEGEFRVEDTWVLIEPYQTS